MGVRVLDGGGGHLAQLGRHHEAALGSRLNPPRLGHEALHLRAVGEHLVRVGVRGKG